MTTITPVHVQPATMRDEAAYMVCGLWMVVGLYIDGWSHQVDKPETFFTVWHLVLYSGFGAAMAYSAFMVRRDGRTGRQAAIGDDRITTLGLVIFVVGAVGDGIWHTVIGIEVDIEGLISPTHLSLMIGGLLLVTLPIRAALRLTEPLGRAALRTVLASTTLALGVICFFLMYLMPWKDAWVFEHAYRPESDASNLMVQRGMAVVLVSTTLFVGALLWAARHWRLPVGAATVMFTAVAFGTSGLNGFEIRLPILAATAAGIVADVLLAQRRRFSIVGLASGAVLWAAFFALLHAETGVEWSPSLWAGAITFAAMTGLGTGLALSAGESRSNDEAALAR